MEGIGGHGPALGPDEVEDVAYGYSESWEGKEERLIQLPHAIVRAGPTYGSVMRIHIGEPEVDEQLDDLIARVGADAGRCLWWVGPTSEPRDLDRRLKQRGFTTLWEFDGLALDDLSVTIPRNPHLVIEPLSWANADAYAARCTDLQDADWQRYLLESAHRYLQSPAHEVHIYIARLGDEVAGYAVLRIEPTGIAHLANALTVKEFRRHGVYSSLTAHRLIAAQAAGCHAVVVVARTDTSAPIVRTYGFTSRCRFLTLLPPRPISP